MKRPARPFRFLRGIVMLAALCAAPMAASAQNAELRYFPFAVDEDALSGVADRSDLNREIGPGSRMFVRDGRFHAVGADGMPNTADDERLRLFGINLSFGANFPSPDQASRFAKRLRKLGFNAVRLHHMDTSPGTSTEDPASILTPGPYPTFNDTAVQRLRGLIQALAHEGLYVNLNLHVGYRFRPDVDAVPAFDAGRQIRPIASPIIVYYPRMIELQEQYARELIARLGLRGNPALAMVEINNESSLLAAWQRNEWSDAVPPGYRDVLRSLWRDWVARRYGSVAKACTIWKDCPSSPEELELLQPEAAGSSSEFGLLLEKITKRLPILSRSVAPGAQEAQRLRDFMLFLADTDRSYLDRMRQTVQAAAGFPVPVTGTQMGYGDILNLTSHEAMDYIDNHFYVDHPDFLRGSSDVRNWRIWNVSLTGKHMDMLRGLAFRRDNRKPFVVSEFNHPFPSLPGAEIAPLTAAFAALQDWDGLFFFDYGETANGAVAPSNFGLSGDWGKYVTVGQSAQLFRAGGLAPLREQAVLPMPVELQTALAAQRKPDALDTYLGSRYGITPAVAWTRAISVSVSGETRGVPLAQTATAPAGQAVSYDSRQGMLRLRAPQMLGVFGVQPEVGASDADLAFSFLDSRPQHAAALLSALDQRPVADSRHLLLTLGSATVGTQPGSIPPRPKIMVRHPSGSDSWTLEPDPLYSGTVSGSRYANGPAWLTLNRARVGWRSNLKTIKVFPLDGRGQAMAQLPAERVRIDGGRISIDLQATAKETSPWYEIQAGVSPTTP